MPKKKEIEDKREISLDEIKLTLRNKMIKNYGSVPSFLESDYGKSVGGFKIRPYLYASGSINYSIISKLCDHFGIGNLSRKVEVIRKTTYYISADKKVS